VCVCVRGERERGCVYKSPDIGECACGAACVGVWVCGSVGVWVCVGGRVCMCVCVCVFNRKTYCTGNLNL
jgi:hypothetical protein